MSIDGSKKRVKKISQKPIKNFSRLPWPRSSEDGTPLGIDVNAKRQDIIKIVHKFFKVPEISMDELLQEVFLAIIHKNYGKSAHDPRKSSFGHYVFMVANNVCINLIHRQKRFEKEKDSLDMPSGNDDKRTLLDTLEVPHKDNNFNDRMEEVEFVMRKEGMWDLARYVRVARSGASSDVIREALSWGDRKVTNKTIREIRLQIQEFLPTMVEN